MHTGAAQRSKIPRIAQGLWALSLILAGLFLAAPFFEPLAIGVTGRATFVLVTAAALLACGMLVPLSRSPWQARAAQHTLVSLLISLGLPILPDVLPAWLPLAVFVILTGGFESSAWTAALALGSGLLLAGASEARTPFEFLTPIGGLLGVALTTSFALQSIKARANELSRKILRMRQGADFVESEIDADQSFRGSPRRKGGPKLRKISGEARTVRDLERSDHLTRTLAPFLELARGMNGAHAALFFDVDHVRGGAFLRAKDGPGEIFEGAVLPLDHDPAGFVLDRGRAFYATDHRTLLWSLPYYKTTVRIGTLLAVPVRVRGAISGILVVDHEETQSLGNAEPSLQRLARLIAQVVENERETVAHAEGEVEFEAAADASQRLAVITEVPEIHRFVAGAVKEMAPRTIGAGIVRLRGDSIEGLPGMSEQFEEWMGGGARISDRTWMSWYLNGAAEAVRIDMPRDRGLPLFRQGGGMPGESLLAHPLRFRNRLEGALVAVGEADAFNASVGRVISLIANQAAAAIALIEMLETNKQLALHDGLTNLLNRRAFDEALERAVSQAERAGQPLSLLMIDLDHFKSLNDTYGHSVGDMALQTAAQEIRAQVRGGDLAARYGGEEFAVILPDTDGPAAFRMAERLRNALASRAIRVSTEALHITASCGVSATDLGYRTREALIRSADDALYASKETGRNRTSLAGAPRG